MNDEARAVFDTFQLKTSGKGLKHEEAVVCTNEGKIVIQKRGKSHQVSFYLFEAKQMKGSNLLHNHPSHDSILSPADTESLHDELKSCSMCDLDGHRMSIVYADDITVKERVLFANAYKEAFEKASEISKREFNANRKEAEKTLYSDIRRTKRFYQDYKYYQDIVKREIKKWTDENAAKYKVEVFYE